MRDEIGTPVTLLGGERGRLMIREFVGLGQPHLVLCSSRMLAGDFTAHKPPRNKGILVIHYQLRGDLSFKRVLLRTNF